MSNESIKFPSTSDNTLSPAVTYTDVKTKVKFDGGCFKQDKITFSHRKTVNIYIAFEINLWDCGYDDYPVLEFSLFGAFQLVKNADTDMFKYSGYGIGFYRRVTFLVANEFGKNKIILEQI